MSSGLLRHRTCSSKTMRACISVAIRAHKIKLLSKIFAQEIAMRSSDLDILLNPPLPSSGGAHSALVYGKPGERGALVTPNDTFLLRRARSKIEEQCCC